MSLVAAVLVLTLALGGFIAGRARALAFASVTTRLHSRPVYHGMLTATLGMAAAISAYGLMLVAAPVAAPWVALALGAAAMAAVLVKIETRFKAREIFERLVKAILIAASIVAILTTVGIVISVVYESLRFFAEVPVLGFLFGTLWAPTATPPSFGIIPLIAGTLLITLIAICVAGPLGLLSAIYLAEYAKPQVRAVVKPLLELLAGIPTVVLGFFAALTVAPLLRDWGESLGLSIASESALAAGLVMGMMIVPLISSLSDDVINAVPQSLRDGSYALGATKSETVKRVVFPAALPGIVSAFILAISRAIGETMIVVMAAGLAANLTFNPFAAVTTVTVQIATLLVGDQEFDSAKTLAAFALGLVLFGVTLVLNYIALRTVRRYKEQYE
jgi:phosphate transport system permease protein